MNCIKRDIEKGDIFYVFAEILFFNIGKTLFWLFDNNLLFWPFSGDFLPNNINDDCFQNVFSHIIDKFNTNTPNGMTGGLMKNVLKQTIPLVK